MKAWITDSLDYHRHDTADLREDAPDPRIIAVMEAAAILTCDHDAGLHLDFDTLVEALADAGYDEQGCWDVWWSRWPDERYPAQDMLDNERGIGAVR